MTPTQKRVLVFVASFIEQQGYSPSLEEIAAGSGFGRRSKGAVSAQVTRLVERGYLRREAGGWTRNLQVTEAGAAAIAAPGRRSTDLSAIPTAALVAELGRRVHG